MGVLVLEVGCAPGVSSEDARPEHWPGGIHTQRQKDGPRAGAAAAPAVPGLWEVGAQALRGTRAQLKDLSPFSGII